MTLDYEINEKLKKVDNASALVNDLLKGHFDAGLSNDIGFLTKKVDETEIQIKNLEFNRDSMTSRIRIINEKSRDHQETVQAELNIKRKTKELTSWLSNKVKTKQIDFSDYRSIKQLKNWEDLLNNVINGDLDLIELIKQSKEYLNNGNSK